MNIKKYLCGMVWSAGIIVCLFGWNSVMMMRDADGLNCLTDAINYVNKTGNSNLEDYEKSRELMCLTFYRYPKIHIIIGYNILYFVGVASQMEEFRRIIVILHKSFMHFPLIIKPLFLHALQNTYYAFSLKTQIRQLNYEFSNINF
ncbi:MAG: hypothetical protein HYS16_00465 [Deltaproteobacteria bacterium]|nr:MAG: hypothetical protein HYS16_00465 [Deltaproteobacteria bacterium]